MASKAALRMVKNLGKLLVFFVQEYGGMIVPNVRDFIQPLELMDVRSTCGRLRLLKDKESL